MKVFLTGASGYIGKSVGRRMSAQGHRVYGLLRSPEKKLELERLEILPVMGNLDSPGSYESVMEDCEAVVHCAAEYGPRYFELDRLLVERAFATPHKALGHRILIYSSGVWVYGNSGSELLSESSPLHPPQLVSPRVEVERKVLDSASRKWRTIVIRPGCVYGHSGSLTAAWFASAVKEKASETVGLGLNHWAMVHIDDLADLYCRALESSVECEIFNACDSGRPSVYACAKAASLAAGAEGRVLALPESEASQRFGPMTKCLLFDQNIDSSRAERLLSWRPRHRSFVDHTDLHFAAWRASQS